MGDQEPQPTVEIGTEVTSQDDDKVVKENVTSPQLAQGVGLEILNSVKDIIFNKPDLEIFDASIIYEITTGDGQQLFYAYRKSPSKFQSQCDIHINDGEGNACLRLVNPSKHPSKVIVRSGGSIIGSVIRTDICWSSPKFIMKDSSKQEICTIRRQKEFCSFLPPCCVFGIGLSAFEVVRKKDKEGKTLPQELTIGIIAKDLINDSHGTRFGSLGIDFADDQLDVNTKCLFIAAAIFLDFGVFNYNVEKSPWKFLIVVTVALLVIVVAAVVVFLVLDSMPK